MDNTTLKDSRLVRVMVSTPDGLWYGIPERAHDEGTTVTLRDGAYVRTRATEPVDRNYWCVRLADDGPCLHEIETDEYCLYLFTRATIHNVRLTIECSQYSVEHWDRILVNESVLGGPMKWSE